MVHLQFLLGQQHIPEHALRDQRGFSAALHKSRLNRTAVGEVAFEMASVHFYTLYRAHLPQSHHTPVVAGFTPTTGFPAIAHIHAAARHEQVAGQPEMLVVSGHHIAAVFHTDQIKKLAAAGL